jgi:hypothetical protein
MLKWVRRRRVRYEQHLQPCHNSSSVQIAADLQVVSGHAVRRGAKRTSGWAVKSPQYLR